LGLALLVGACDAGSAAPGQELSWSELVRTALWADDGAAGAALQELRADPESTSASRMRFHDFQEIVRQGRPLPAVAPAAEPASELLTVTLPDGRGMDAFVQLPPGYGTHRPWPVLLAMHGGPPGSVEGARRSAARMVEVWSEPAATFGWIVVSPVMSTVVAAGPRTADRLPYEVLRPGQVEVLLDAVRARYRIDPDRIVSTGISLGSNFSIGFAAADPDRFAAIVPVSTEGDSRRALLENLRNVPVYVLEGSRDRNIRGIDGPRELELILTELGADLVYREFSDRAHEGFQEHYPDVLRWLSSRPREPWPRRVVRQPHNGIMGLSRRAFWVETDTRQGYVDAAADAEDNRVLLEARWAREITLHLSDRLIDLDRTVVVVVNGERVAALELDRSIPAAIETIRQHGDTGRVVAATATVPVPVASPPAGGADPDDRDTAGDEAATASNPMARTEPWERLSFWEMYATRALIERLPELGLEAAGTVARPDGTLGIRIERVDPAGPFGDSGMRRGDVLVEVGGEPFYPESGGLDFLHEWLLRELTARATAYEVVVERHGERLNLAAVLALGPYRRPAGR